MEHTFVFALSNKFLAESPFVFSASKYIGAGWKIVSVLSFALVSEIGRLDLFMDEGMLKKVGRASFLGLDLLSCDAEFVVFSL